MSRVSFTQYIRQMLLRFGLVLVALVLLGAAMVIAANRFARRREREGAWDASGPIHPTEPPRDWGTVPGYAGRRPTIETEPETPRPEEELD